MFPTKRLYQLHQSNQRKSVIEKGVCISEVKKTAHISDL
jgi:hypothetical protein